MDTALPSFSVSQLRRLLGGPSSPLLIDVRRTPAYTADSVTLPGALRRAPETPKQWARALPQDRVVLAFCVHGHEVSQNAVRVLRGVGTEAQLTPDGPSHWVTRERPKIDRIACPWLVRRFIDPLAEFHYVPADEVNAFAAAKNAVAYDIPDVRFSHRGERCSFDAIIKDFGLRDDALDALANIVRGADTGRPELTAQSAGLLAISLGLSELYADDHAMLTQGMLVYDALYAWLSRAQAEIHNAKLFEKA